MRREYQLALNLGKGRAQKSGSGAKSSEKGIGKARGAARQPDESEPEDGSEAGDAEDQEEPGEEPDDRGEDSAEVAEQAAGEAPSKPRSSLARGRKAGDKVEKSKPKATKPGAVPSFMKRGAKAQGEMKRAEVRAKERADASKSLYRYWMRPGDSRRITFLDGKLDADGMLDVGYFYEHCVPDGGKFANVMCTLKNDDPSTGRSESCPICEAGDEPAYVAAFTVLDWEPWEDREGKEHEYRRRLYVPKFKTLKKLQTKATRLAEKEGTDGLVGVTFDVTRSSDRSERVGDDFELVECMSIEQLQEELEKPEDALPADYGQEAELRWRTPEEIEDLGLAPRRERGFGAKDRGRDRKARSSDAGKHL